MKTATALASLSFMTIFSLSLPVSAVAAKSDAPIESVPAAVRAVADQPNVFLQRTYHPEPLPTFQNTQSQLPQPVIPGHPEWERLYWRAWELGFEHLMQPAPGSGFVSNFIDPAFNQNTFQWDSCFMVLFARYAEPRFLAIGTLDNFYAKQHADGYICREITRATGKDFVLWNQLDNTINPPLFSWVEWENYQLTGDKSRFRDVLVPLVKYYLWIQGNRRRPNGLYWNTGLGSGEDDLVRSKTAYSYIDMTAQQAQNAYYIARIAEAVGDKPVTDYFDSQNKELAGLVTKLMWDAKTGFFYDLKEDGSPTRIKTVLGFWPMLAHIASKAQAKALVGHLEDPKEFWRPNVVPALAANEPGYTPKGEYWNGSVWAPTNYMVLKGLQDYGYDDLATRVTEIYLDNMSKVLDQTGTIFEHYAPEMPMGLGVKDFVGWSGDGPIALFIENVLGIRASAANGRIDWRPRLAGENGLKNLAVGPTHVSLVASPIAGGKRALTMTTDQSITVVVDAGVGRKKTFHLKPGTVSKTVAAIVPIPH
ncbi:MAG TPA: trehalase family glycosidase [Capsulimonadaceae bacterium]|nr:trehalase family glycosidase [Capsulimonadaceae bacterium]